MNRVLFSSQSDDYKTPGSVYEALNREFAFNFDPCPLYATTGLEIDWPGNVFVNPPYSKLAEFMDKGWRELQAGVAQCIVFLVPARTDTRWFHNYCLKAAEIRFIRGRLKFGGAKNNAPFPSMIVIFKSA